MGGVRVTSLRNLLPLAALLLAVLAACAPAAQEGPRVRVEQFTGQVSFYPHEPGASWRFLPDGATLDEPPLTLISQGPTLLAGEPVTGWRLVGRGLDEVSYRRYGSDGVHLVRTVRPGAVIDFDPPVQEFPSQAALRVGASWEGTTTASVTFPEAREENRRSTLQVRYRYDIVDRRPTRVPAGEFDIYVINFESETTDDEGTVVERISQTGWFEPYVGWVRHPIDHYLVGTNFAIPSDRNE